MYKRHLKIGAILGVLAVILGAFGAHALKQMVSTNAVNTFETGVRYQFYHVYALFLTGILFKEFPSKWLKMSGNLFILGTILFSGSLYILTFYQAIVKPVPVFIGIITPFGGLAYILGWVFLLIGIMKKY